MTMSGLRKASDVEREKKEEEEREKARIAKAGTNGSENQKLPTTTLAELCRQGGGPTLAEMVMTVSLRSLKLSLVPSLTARQLTFSFPTSLDRSSSILDTATAIMCEAQHKLV